MVIQVDPEDFSFLEKVERLGDEGLSCEEIATALGMSRGQLNYRLLQLGYRTESHVRLRSTTLGTPFAELRQTRTVVPKSKDLARAVA